MEIRSMLPPWIRSGHKGDGARADHAEADMPISTATDAVDEQPADPAEIQDELRTRREEIVRMEERAQPPFGFARVEAG